MTPLHHPTPRTVARMGSPLPRLVAAGLDVQRVAEAKDQRVNVGVVVSLVSTEVLLPSTLLGARMADRKALQGRLHQPLVMHVGSRDGHREGHAVSIRKKGTLGAGLRAVRRIGAGFFPRPAAPS